MAKKGMPASPTAQAIHYEIGFIDKATDGLDEMQDTFDNTVDAMDSMVDDLGKAADTASESSKMYKEAVEDMVAGESLDLGLQKFEDSMGDPSLQDGFRDNMEDAANEFVHQMETGLKDTEFGGAGGKGGFFEGLKEIFPMLGKALKLFVRWMPTIGGAIAAFRALAPLLEMIGFFIDILIMPFEELFVNIGMHLIPIVNNFAALMYDMVDELIPAAIRVMKAFANFIIDKVVPIMKILIFDYVIPFIKWVAELTQKIIEWKGAIYVLYGVLSAMLLPLILTVTSAVWAFTVALLANPITWVVGLIVGLIGALVYLYKNFEGVREVVHVVWGTIKTFFETLFGWFQTLYSWISERFSKWFDLGGANKMGKDFAESFIDGMGDGGIGMDGTITGKTMGVGAAGVTLAPEAIGEMAGKMAMDTPAMGIPTDFAKFEAAPVKFKPLPEFEKPDASKEVADPIVKELRLGFENTVTAIEDRSLDHMDISEEIRKLGAFAG